MSMNHPFHDPNSNPLPDANDIDQEFAADRPPLQGEKAGQNSVDRRRLRNIFIGLLGIGLILGVLTATGIVWVLNRFDLTDPPVQERTLEGKNSPV